MKTHSIVIGIALWGSIILFTSCNTKLDVHHTLQQAVRECEESGCYIFVHVPNPDDVSDIRDIREHIVVSSSFRAIEPDSIRRRLNMSTCSKFKYPIGELTDIDKEVFGEREITFIDVDTMHVPSYMKDMERIGAFGPVFVVKPILFSCPNGRYIVTGFIWNRQMFLYQFGEDGNLVNHTTYIK